MPQIARGEENTVQKINWFSDDQGVPTNAYSMEYRIFDLTGGGAGIQKFPLTGWEDVSAAPGRFDTGSYYAYDNVGVKGWTPASDANLGNWRIEWRWKYRSISSYQYGAEDFTMIAEEVVIADLYIGVADIRAEGLTNPPFTDEEISNSIALWQELLDRACRQWFLPRTLTIEFDGNNRDMVHFGIPIVSVEYLRINGDSVDLDASLYKAYGNPSEYPHHRGNPRIKLVHSTQINDIHVAPFVWGELRFYKGYKNQVVKGVFGYVDGSGRPPRLIKRALTKLVCEKLTRPIIPGATPPEPSSLTFAGVVIEETTDGHSLRYGGGASYATRRVGLSGITTDPEILDIIRLYRAPIGIATPSHWSYES